MDREKYRYQKFISDIACQDVQSHNQGHSVLRVYRVLRFFEPTRLGNLGYRIGRIKKRDKYSVIFHSILLDEKRNSRDFS